MSKRALGKGKIVKRMTHSGTPIGPWCIIEMANCNQVLLRRLPDGVESLPAFRTSVWVPKTLSLQVSKDAIEKLITGDGYVLTHIATKQWEKLFDDPDLLMLYSQDGFKKVYCEIDNYTKYYSISIRKQLIRLTVKNVFS